MQVIPIWRWCRHRQRWQDAPQNNCLALCGMWQFMKRQKQFTEARIEFISYSNFIVRMAAILPAKGSESWRCFWFVCACWGSYNQDSLTSSQSFCHNEEPGRFIDWQVQRGRQRQKKRELKLWWEMSVLSSLPSAEPVSHHSEDLMAQRESRLENNTESLNHRCPESWHGQSILSYFTYST